MKNTLIILGVACMLVSCSRQSSAPPQWVVENDKRIEIGLSPHFALQFDKLFLSQEPLRYQDNVQFLSSIQKTKLNPKETELVRAKLKAFLATTSKARPYAPDSEHTGISSEISFLRLQSVQVLAEIGKKEDATFIRSLDAKAEGEHPMFEEECQKAIKTLETR